MVRDAIEEFCDELVRRVPSQIEPILLGEKEIPGKQTLGQDPEQFVCQYLVWPVCESLGYDHVSEWYHEGHGGSVDLYVRSTQVPVFGEVKRLNHYKYAVRDLREYLKHRTASTRYGIATDGINWLFVREPRDQRENVDVLEFHSFRGAMFDYLISISEVSPALEGQRVLWNSSIGKVAKQPYQEYGKLRRERVTNSISAFREGFAVDNLSRYTAQEGYDGTITTFQDHPSEEKEADFTLDDFR